ncbi:hypothetical protein JCM3775_000870 [Rhodotorula graminis]|uniref:FAD dependent oxidoreductase domain-containing protein n=1 Tax=Rhodotorula graminis (strain WP1) TaxID=578459 RepID=A0A194S984_RHOGW|nr:uncharacterized protein RHOBADRAFT_64859 [Rhodotorula graminis WP1]KPV75956.1 hypothetical protein RHOBADRAFT_64859 [Rhodotorula graminis WP1]
MPARHVVVLGAGVVGLSTAIRLLEHGYKVDVVARDLPDDPKSIAFTSPWAGAHHVSVATGSDMRMHEFDKHTFEVMSTMIEQGHGSLFFCTQTEFREQSRPTGDAGKLSQLSLVSRYHPDFRWLDEHELPAGIAHGATFKAILIDTPTYLSSLVARLKELGGSLHRSNSLSSLDSVLSVHPSFAHADLVVNCSGLGARTLVPDDKVFPTRGQLVIVKAPWVKEGRTRLGDGVYTYTIPRPKTGHVVLGGCAEKNNWDPRPRSDMARQIKERCLALCPELLPPDKRGNGTSDDLDVVEDAVGLRPTREGGIRLELGALEGDGRRVAVVHNYGHGGYGFQSSWGSAEAAVELVEEALSRRAAKL